MRMTNDNTVYLNKITKIMYAFVAIVVVSLLINLVYISNKVIQPSNEIIKNEYIDIQKDEIKKEVEFALKILEILKKDNNITSSYIPESVREKAIDLIYQYNDYNDNYIFALDDNWKLIIHQDKNRLDYYNNEFQHVTSNIRNTISSGENWISYDFRPKNKLKNEQRLIKYSYVIYLPEWKMTIGSGYSEKRINNNADDFIHKVNILVNSNKSNILIINLFLILLAILFAVVSNLAIKLQFLDYDDSITQGNKKIQKTLAKLDIQASRDPITNIPNKKSAIKFFDIEKERNEDFNYYVHIFEIDDFNHKSLISGCNSRESMLKEFSMSLEEIKLSNQRLFHIEHDRFILATKAIGEPPEFTKRLINKLGESLDNILLCGNASKISFISATVKFSDKHEQLDDILEKCEYALRYAKSNKLNHVLYSDEIEAIRNREIGLSTELMSAVQNDELEVHYQPQFCTNTNQVTGLEALVRWNNKIYGDVSPAEFIPLAETKGQIHAIGTFAIRNALKDMEKVSPLTVTINVLPVELLSPNFESFITTTIQELNADTSKVIFDITKQIPINDVSKASEVMHNLKKLGIRFSISSVGVGHSSLNYVCELPVDEIKIPLEVVKKIDSHNKYKSFINSAIEFANSTGLNIVLEGVETKGQYQQITGLRNTLVQGFKLSKAKPIDEIIKELS